MASALEAAKGEISYPFSRFAQHSADHPPSGINAANGYWVSDTRDDPAVAPKTQLSPPNELTGVLVIFWTFLGGAKQAFSRPNVSSDLTAKPSLALPALEAYAGDIASVFIDVWNIWKGDVDDGKKAKDELIADIRKVYNDCNNDGNLTQGTHANGFISKDIANAAQNAMGLLDSQYPKGQNTDTGRLADSLRVVFSKLASLPTDGNDPWLVGAWQISFQFISSAAAQAFK